MTVADVGSRTDVSVRDDIVEGRHGKVPIRRYQPLGARSGAVPGTGTGARTAAGPPVVVWLHGGAFSHGGLDQQESHAVGLALAESGFAVTAVDYRRVPPWSWWRPPRPGVLGGIRYPVPLDDVIDVVRHVRTESDVSGTDLVLGGASAGACLATAAALRLHREGVPGPDRLLLAYGTFHAALPRIRAELRARIRGRHAVMQFQPGTVEKMNRNYAGSAEAMADPFAFPGGHDLTGMPPTLVLDADRDSLRASGEAFARELAAAGVAVSHQVVPESSHGFLDRPRTAGFDDGIERAVRWLERP
jgi:acetyl esterase/lipase